MPADFDLDVFYDDFPRIEEDFGALLDESLDPRGPELLYDVVRGLGLARKADVIDVGCGEGRHALRLASELGMTVTGVDPVAQHVRIAAASAAEQPAADRMRFAYGSAASIPSPDAAFDLVWCRDVMVHVADQSAAYLEMRRVARPGARAVVYQTFATRLLEPHEGARLFATMGVVPGSAEVDAAESAMREAGWRVDECHELGSEWGEYAEERSGSRRLLHAARLLRDPARYRARFGDPAYDIMLGDCLWQVYRMIGKLSPRIYVLTAI